MKKLSLILIIFFANSLYAKKNKVDFCGLYGSVTDRIAECNKTCAVKDSKGKQVKWQLVSKTMTGQKIWLDPSTSLVWSDVFPYGLNYWDAELLCKSTVVSRQYSGFKAHMLKEWRVPTIKEFRHAYKNKGFSCLEGKQSYHYWGHYENTKNFLSPVFSTYAGGKAFEQNPNILLNMRCVISKVEL